MNSDNAVAQTINWKQVGIFLALTFAITFLLDLVIYLTSGYEQVMTTGLLFQVQMLIPAAVAIALQLFVFRNSPIYHLRDRPRWFFYYFLGFTIVYALLALSTLAFASTPYLTVASVVVQALNIGGLILLVVLRISSGRESFSRAGLKGGKIWYYILFGLILAGIYVAMTALNVVFGLGQTVNVREVLAATSGGQATGLDALPDMALLLVVGFQAVIVGPILALLLAFGEEYGWRGYLQGELIKIGKIKGIFLVGVIWGLWHAPAILMGHNYPGYPVLGVFLMTLYTIALAFFFGFAVLKSGSVWLAAFLHGLNNQVLSFLILAIYKPNDPVLSFGIGVYGLIVWGIVVAALLILGRKVWQAPLEPAAIESAS